MYILYCHLQITWIQKDLRKKRIRTEVSQMGRHVMTCNYQGTNHWTCHQWNLVYADMLRVVEITQKRIFQPFFVILQRGWFTVSIFHSFFTSFFTHFYCERLLFGDKNERKMDWKTTQKWPKNTTMSTPNVTCWVLNWMRYYSMTCILIISYKIL